MSARPPFAGRHIALPLAAAVAACAAPPAPGLQPPGSQPPDSQPPDTRPPGTVTQAPPPGVWPALQTELPTWALEIAETDYAYLKEDPEDRERMVPARFRAGDETYEVMAGYRGWSSRRLRKKSFKIEFPDGVRFEGRRRLNLLAQWRDGGMLTEKLWYDLCAAAGLRVPRVRYVNLDINGERHGVMTEIEAVDKPFLAAHRFDVDADIYRCGMFDCELRDGPPDAHQYPWEKKTNEDEPWQPLHDLLSAINRTPNEEFGSAMEQALELDAYLVWLAVDAAIGNRAVSDSRSYLVRDKGTGRWTYVPWDLNNAVSLYEREKPPDQAPRFDRGMKAFTAWDAYAYSRADSQQRPPAWSVLNTRLLDDPGLRARLVERTLALLETRFREEEIGPRADALQALLAPHLAADPWVDPAYPPLSAQYARRWVRERREFLLAQLPRYARHGESQLVIDRVGVDGQNRVFVQLYNTTSDDELRLSDFAVAGNLRTPELLPGPDVVLGPGQVWTLREGASDPLGRLESVPDRTRPEAGLFRLGVRAPVDLLYTPPLQPGRSHGRSPSGSETFASFEEAAP